MFPELYRDASSASSNQEQNQRILVIAFVNHALDHLVGNVVDAGITNEVARLGSRYADDVCSSDFTICANKSIPELCHMPTWSSVVPTHSLVVQAHDRCSPSLHSSIQDRVMERKSLGSASLCSPLASPDRKRQAEPHAKKRVIEVVKSEVSEGALIY